MRYLKARRMMSAEYLCSGASVYRILVMPKMGNDADNVQVHPYVMPEMGAETDNIQVHPYADYS